MKSKNQSGRLAFCGMVAALMIVILLLGALLPTAEIALPALAGILLIPVVIELGRRAALSVYAVTALLSLLLVPSWEPKLLFAFFFGYYPVLKAVLESHLPRWGEWLCKLAVFNAVTVVAYWVMLRFLGLEADAFTVAGINMPWVFLAAGNVIFVLYDMGMTQLIGTYVTRFSHRLRRLFRF